MIHQLELPTRKWKCTYIQTFKLNIYNSYNTNEIKNKCLQLYKWILFTTYKVYKIAPSSTDCCIEIQMFKL